MFVIEKTRSPHRISRGRPVSQSVRTWTRTDSTRVIAMSTAPLRRGRRLPGHRGDRTGVRIPETLDRTPVRCQDRTCDGWNLARPRAISSVTTTVDPRPGSEPDARVRPAVDPAAASDRDGRP